MSELNPSRITVADAAAMLSKLAGTQVTVEQIAADVTAGMPANEDGTLNLLDCTAWLASQQQKKRPAKKRPAKPVKKGAKRGRQKPAAD